jgi:uncharacterized iron-regulated protein
MSKAIFFNSVIALFACIFSNLACAHSGLYSRPGGDSVLHGTDLSPIPLWNALSTLQKGAILVLGEQHGTAEQAAQHMKILNSLREQGHQVSVAMEFFDHTQQEFVNQWRSGQLSEADFLKAVRWGGFSFEYYRGQSEFPRWDQGERTFAINAPRSVTSKVARTGIESLTAEERALFPADFQRGSPAYFERFQEIMGGHVKPEDLERYFLAQSIWDDTMADRILKAQKEVPGQTLVVVVGDFHVMYDGGLPDRLKARGAASVVTLSQVNVFGMTADQQQKALEPSIKYGPRADWLWTSQISPPSP